MTLRSAALLLHREVGEEHEVWIAHLGGPFWAGKEEGAWTLPKGLVDPGDADDLATARREFAEEIGVPAPETEYRLLGEFAGSGKTFVVYAAAAPGFDPPAVRSNTFELEWPPRSGRRQHFPEVDAAAWVRLDDARRKLAKSQRPILDALIVSLENGEGA
jgi:predicted NUDIX family NTP pyrophosphohydrolase